ncbi:MAG TPA: hypothetical protein VN025_13380 [Candidatus Dormibacteraeota bacterium]|jgi:hypothetical protein|nr:hypothetical protein [Candidatus Dormibacteraeota bacterium]
MKTIPGKSLLPSLCALALIALPSAAGSDKTDISERGVPHFEAPIPPGAHVALHLRSGDIRIVGSENGKLTVDISGKNKNNIDDLRYRLISSGNNAELHVSGGPRNDLNIEVHIPRNSELYARISAGDVTIENIIGSKDVELHAGDLTINVGNPQDYSSVEASVNAGDISAAPFGEEHGGLFRSFHKSGPGKFTLYAHVGAGDLTLR